MWSSLARVVFRIGNRAVVRKRLEDNPALIAEQVDRARAKSIDRNRRRIARERCELCGHPNSPEADYLRRWYMEDLVDHWYCPDHLPPPSRKMRKLMDNSVSFQPSVDDWFADLERRREAGLLTSAQYETQRKRLIDSI